MSLVLIGCSSAIVCTLAGGLLGLIVGESVVSHDYPELRGFGIFAYTVVGTAIGSGLGIVIGVVLAVAVKRRRPAE
jgi:hypothetical protein